MSKTRNHVFNNKKKGSCILLTSGVQSFLCSKLWNASAQYKSCHLLTWAPDGEGESMLTCNPDGCWGLCLEPPGRVDPLLPCWGRGLNPPKWAWNGRAGSGEGEMSPHSLKSCARGFSAPRGDGAKHPQSAKAGPGWASPWVMMPKAALGGSGKAGAVCPGCSQCHQTGAPWGDG